MTIKNQILEGHALADRAMLVQFSVSQWGGQLKDDAVTEKVHKDYEVASEEKRHAGLYRKNLLGGKEALAKVKKMTNASRELNYFLTLPWLDTGWRILPAKMYFHYMERMESMRQEWQAAVEDFIGRYDEHVERGRKVLGLMFNAEDYPSPSALRRKFSFNVAVMPLPVSNDFRANITADEATKIREEIEARVTSQVEASMLDVWKRLFDLVEHMQKKLKEYKVNKDGSKEHPFRDSLVTNITDLLDVLPMLNMTGDPELDRIAKEARAKLTAYDPDELRADKKLRTSVAKEAGKIMDAMALFMGGE